jgi:CTP synthase (UTP-ammonia lyase)
MFPRDSAMPKSFSVGLIGDFDPTVPAHQAIPLALQAAAHCIEAAVSFEWIPTGEIGSAARVDGFSGLWCVPASPYHSAEGALRTIRYAREKPVPFLGTCGGFQHALLEHARNVLGWTDAGHAETEPGTGRQVITPLQCALVEASGLIRIKPGTHLAAAYKCAEVTEGYRCRYGLNPDFQAALLAGPLRASAYDEHGEVRAVELQGHPFFVATLFQPERAALNGRRAPLVETFARACLAGQTSSNKSKPDTKAL